MRSSADTRRETPAPIPGLAGARAYAPPRHPAPTDLNLAGNEGDRPDPALLDALRARGVDVLRGYPSARSLEAALAERLGAAPEEVYVTAGGDETIDRLCRAYLAPGRRVVLPQPTFVMFPHYAALAGATVDAVAWPDGPYPREAVLARVADDTAMVVVVSPNNPSGAVATADDLRALAAAAPHAVLVVDLAYVDYADEDLTAAARALPNAVVVRTLSKAWGLAGLRVGFAVGPAALLAPMRAAGGPYSVAGPSLALAEAALAGGGERRARHVARVRAEREELQRTLQGLGAEAPPSQGNFAFARVRDAEWLRDALAGLGIAVRVFPGDPALRGAVRITCPGDDEAVARLQHALRAALAPQALLFDMDGVLVDVSGSYREAIRLTAAQLGVAVGPGDVAAAKAEGDANNDWELTRRLLARRGVEVPLDDVVARFESLYQGDSDRPGLWQRETLLPDRAVLARLARRLPLGVVTGRPRHDAERTLRHHGTDDLFAALVCMEDARRKPDPAPVREALRRLDVERAWLVGDTVDDVRAARAAGVVPLGVAAPGEDAAAAAEVLLRAGAARMLDGIGTLEELLP